MKKKDSPVLTLLQTVWDNVNKTPSRGHSWRMLNSGMHDALRLAITHGFGFAEDDVIRISKRFNAGYWWGDAECLYALAAGGPDYVGGPDNDNQNLSACIAFEAMFQRPAYIWLGRRLAHGSEVYWWEQWPKFHEQLKPISPARWVNKHHGATRFWVTGISADGLSLSWYQNKGNRREGKPKRRIIVTRADIAVAQRHIRELQKEFDALPKETSA